MPVISVIMPVYNAEKYVYEAIDSILKQTFTDFELLIFNDCSTDTSREIILSFQDARIRLIDSPVNTGYVKHLNDGLLQAKGQYIARMDADDRSDLERFSKQMNYLDQHPEVGACGSWIQFIGDKEGVVDYPIDHLDIVTHLFLFGNAMAHPTVMLRKSVLTVHQLVYNASLEPAEDYDLWTRLADVAQLHNIPEVLLHYRLHDRNESVVKKAKQDRAVRYIRERMMKYPAIHSFAVFQSFIFNEFPSEKLSNTDLTSIRRGVQELLATGKYNPKTMKTALSNRFVAWCKASDLSGYHKVKQYIAFPKHFFSIRICLSLGLNT
jgi:glycosyltransferase involved in cell wall biosynthesis